MQQQRRQPSNLANILTMTRIMLIPAFFVTAAYHMRQAARLAGIEGVEGLDSLEMVAGEPTFRLGTQIILIIIAATDFLDGYIARKTQSVTTLGSLLDPMADKLFVLTSFVLFAWYRQIPVWLAVVCISKDLLIVVGWAMFAAVEHEVRATPVRMGKWAMAFSFITVCAVVFNLPLPIRRIIFLITGSLSAICFLQYLWRGLRISSLVPSDSNGSSSTSDSP